LLHLAFVVAFPLSALRYRDTVETSRGTPRSVPPQKNSVEPRGRTRQPGRPLAAVSTSARSSPRQQAANSLRRAGAVRWAIPREQACPRRCARSSGQARDALATGVRRSSRWNFRHSVHRVGGYTLRQGVSALNRWPVVGGPHAGLALRQTRNAHRLLHLAPAVAAPARQRGPA
jgi:hypothetical protein